jgi:hypothetical protein
MAMVVFGFCLVVLFQRQWMEFGYLVSTAGAPRARLVGIDGLVGGGCLDGNIVAPCSKEGEADSYFLS